MIICFWFSKSDAAVLALRNSGLLTIRNNGNSIFFLAVYPIGTVDFITINPGNGYFIEYNFTVRMTEFTAFNGFASTRVSEFM